MYQYPKPILIIEQQIQTYIDAGMTFDSKEQVENSLLTIGYYRLRGYSFQLYDKAEKRYVEGTTFENILRLYHFDQELASIVFSMIAKIEVALRARLSQALLIHQDALILQDSSIFENKLKYWRNMSSVASEIARSSDAFIKHNFKKYQGEVPVWAVVEVLSFGTLSKLIKNLKHGRGSSYAELVKHYRQPSEKGTRLTPSKDMFTSWIYSVSVLRNMCAHNSRIYNRTILMAPQILKIDKTESTPEHNGLYQVLLAMKYLRSSDEDWREFVTELNGLITKYDGVIVLSHMNFPHDWHTHLYV